VARKGFEWHGRDRRIYYNLAKMLLETGEAASKQMAVKILTEHAANIPFPKVSQIFDQEEEVDASLNQMFKNVFTSLDYSLRQG